MENENMMLNDEVTEATEYREYTNSGSGLKIIGGVLATLGAIWGVSKLKKIIKARKEEKYVIIDESENAVTESDENVEVDETEETKNKSKKKK